MLSLAQLIGAAVTAADGDVGASRDAYLDVDDWVVDTLVIEPTALRRTMPLALAPDAVHRVDAEAGRVHLDLSLAQVDEAPSVDLRRAPDAVAGTGGGDDGGESARDVGEDGRASSPFYSPSPPWGRPATIGDEVLDRTDAAPGTAVRDAEGAEAAAEPRVETASGEHDDIRAPGPYGVRGILGDEVLATDGEIGTVDDLLADPETWHVDCLVVASQGWLAGTHSSVSTTDVVRVDRSAGAVHLRVASGEVDVTGTCGGAQSARRTPSAP